MCGGWWLTSPFDECCFFQLTKQSLRKDWLNMVHEWVFILKCICGGRASHPLSRARAIGEGSAHHRRPHLNIIIMLDAYSFSRHKRWWVLCICCGVCVCWKSFSASYAWLYLGRCVVYRGEKNILHKWLSWLCGGGGVRQFGDIDGWDGRKAAIYFCARVCVCEFVECELY